LKFRFVIFGAKLLENVDENDNCIPQTSQSIVNFINILQADFAAIFFRQKITKLNCNCRLTAQSSSEFYHNFTAAFRRADPKNTVKV
jgi:hypothetical protein